MKKWWWLLLVVAMPAMAQVEVHQPWARATPPGARVGGAFLTIENKAARADRLVGASSPRAERVELHTHLRDGNRMQMRSVEAFEIPAGGRFELKPGGGHLMFMAIPKPFEAGETLPVTLRFEHAGDIRIEIPVAELGARGPAGDGHGHGMKH